jgi:hypothetical protein
VVESLFGEDTPPIQPLLLFELITELLKSLEHLQPEIPSFVNKKHQQSRNKLQRVREHPSINLFFNAMRCNPFSSQQQSKMNLHAQQITMQRRMMRMDNAIGVQQKMISKEMNNISNLDLL